MIKFSNNKNKIFTMILCDLLAITIAIFLSTTVTTGFKEMNNVLIWYTINVPLNFLLLVCFKLYTILFSNVGFLDGIKCILCSVTLFLINLLFVFVFKLIEIDTLILMVCLLIFELVGIRFSKRILSCLYSYLKKPDYKRVMIIGGGHTGTLLIREALDDYQLGLKPVCILDDDTSKLNKRIYGVKIVGKIDEIEKYCKEYKIDNIIVTMPSVSKKKLKYIYNLAKNTSCKVQTLPSVEQLVNEEIFLPQIRDVDVLDLLGREQITIDNNSISQYIKDKTVLVTGGGGSIGSELCRQISKYSPKLLIIVDIYENNAYEIEQEFKRHCPELNLLVLIASIRDKGKIEDIFKNYKPDIVFNAAAHKHVPLMETSPNEAIKNNVFGTLNLVKMADKYNTNKFVQISTDKAVNPTNVMGASKRICEMIIQAYSKKSKTEFVAVRFGNVLGSNGSVIPLFKKQIEEGGPVTVTHKDIIRYFMTINEAVQLVLQAGSLAKGGEIFVLDMGEQVRIYDLAYNLIKLSGFEPNVDIEIRCIGLRPGEKLFEEKLMSEEGLEKTSNNLIFIGKPLKVAEDFFEKLDSLYIEIYKESNKTKNLIKEIVPTYNFE